MGEWRTRAEIWLSSDEAGNEDAAESAFTEVFRAIPTSPPSEDFVRRTVAAAFAKPRKNRRLGLYAAAAAGVLVVCFAAVALRIPLDWSLAAVASTGAESVLSIAGVMATVAGLWASAGHAGAMLVGVVLMREVIVMLFAVGLVGAGASWALQKVLREQPGARTFGPVCV
jgi:hypothetical protein